MQGKKDQSPEQQLLSNQSKIQNDRLQVLSLLHQSMFAFSSMSNVAEISVQLADSVKPEHCTFAFILSLQVYNSVTFLNNMK